MNVVGWVLWAVRLGCYFAGLLVICDFSFSCRVCFLRCSLCSRVQRGFFVLPQCVFTGFGIFKVFHTTIFTDSVTMNDSSLRVFYAGCFFLIVFFCILYYYYYYYELGLGFYGIVVVIVVVFLPELSSLILFSLYSVSGWVVYGRETTKRERCEVQAFLTHSTVAILFLFSIT